MQPSKPTDELQSQLWELVYELLPDEEADALRARITSEPAVARAYATVKLKSELLGMAARLDEPPIELSATSRRQASEPAELRKPPAAPPPRLAAAVNWLVGLAALLLFGFVGVSAFWPAAPAPADHQLAAAPERDLRTIVTSPAEFHAEATNPINVRTVTLEGTPISTPVELRVFDGQEQLVLSQTGQTDRSGNWLAQLPGAELSNSTRFEVLAKGSDPQQAVSNNFNVIQDRRLTYLSLDKPYYRPGETVYFRSLTLSRFDLRVDQEVAVRFGVQDTAGTLIERSRSSGTSERGVANGAFELPVDQAAGKYTCVVESPDGQFAAQRRDFYVHDYELPAYQKTLRLERESYTPGDEVVAHFEAKLASGGPAAAVPLEIRAVVDGQRLTIPETQVTDGQGAYQIRFRLPNVVRQSQGWVEVSVGEAGQQETIAKNMLINLGQVEVNFFAEGGQLVPALPNRVYFQCRDPLQRPVHVEGAVLDRQNREVAKLATTQEGRGKVEFVPAAGMEYRLRIDKPVGARNQAALPEVSHEATLVMQTGSGVFGPADQIDVTLQAAWPIGPIVVAAKCRGAIVGLRRVERGDFEQRAPGRFVCAAAVDLAPEAAGVIRVTAYHDDSPISPAIPLVERLVFRRPQRALRVNLQNLAASYRPGELAELQLLTTDENGAPQPAVLGVAAVDDGLLSLADDKSPSITTFYYLTSELQRPRDLEDANLILSDRDGAAEALDLFLGTRGWRRFDQVNLEQLAGQRPNAQPALGTPQAAATSSLPQQIAADYDLPSLPPITLAGKSSLTNKVAVPAESARLAERTWRLRFWRARPRLARTVGQVGIIGGAVLLAVWVSLWLRHWTASRRFWLATLVLSAASLAIGVGLLLPSDKRETEIASVATGSISQTRVDEGSSDREAAGEKLPWQAEGESADGAGDAAGSANKSSEQGLAPADTPAPQALAESVSADDARPAEETVDREGEPEPRRPRSRSRNIVELQPQSAPLAPTAPDDRPAERSRPPALADAAAPAPQPMLDLEMRLQSLRRGSSTKQMVPAPNAEMSAAASSSERSARDRFTVRRYAAPAAKASPQFRPETLFWDPLVISDADGQATIRFGLPAAGVYRLQIDGHLDGRLGSAAWKLPVE